MPKRQDAIVANIGFLSFHAEPTESIPPMRLRAMQAEARFQGADFVVLDWRDFDESSGQIQTWVFTPSGWKGEQRPLPDLVYILGAPISERQGALISWARETRPYIYDVGVDKARLNGILAGTGCGRYIVPNTEIPKSDGLDVLIGFLQSHGSAVMKRASGNKGVGLQFLLKSEAGWRFGSDSSDNARTLDDIAATTFSKIKGRLAYRRFVIQKYICSVAGDGRPADIRVHVQRDADHAWGVTKAYVRLSEVGSMVTNISRGGYQGPLDQFLKTRTSRQAAEIEAEMLAAAMEIAELQSQAAPRPLSELGIDFLLDEDDRIWLIETNALPQSALHEQERAIKMIGYALSFL